MTRRITPQTTLDNLKKEAKRWKKALDSGDMDAKARLHLAYPAAPAAAGLRDVQHALAREYGLTGWRELRAALAPHTGNGEQDRLIHQFLEYSCPDHHVRGRPAHIIARGGAMRILERHPEIARANLYTAVVCGEIDLVSEMLRKEPELARRKSSTAAIDRTGVGGAGDIEKDISPKGWEPLLYLCFTRLPLAKANDNAMAIAQLLLEHGADPNCYFMAGDSRYTPLVGVIGEGEEDRPPHPRRDELARLLLERGAEPYDIQVIYNIHFHGRILWFLKLMYEFSVRADREADWRDPEWHFCDMGGYGTGARWHLWVAVEHNDLELADWCLAHGANPNAEPPRARQLPQWSLYEYALRLGQVDVAELLARYGAARTAISEDDEDSVAAAALQMDRERAARILRKHPEFLRSHKAIFAAAREDREDAVALLLDLGVPIEVEDKSKQRALHVAASADAPKVARLLITRGAEIDPVEANWSNTPLYNALWGEVQRMIDLLSPLSRDVWALTFLGKVERLREVLTERPELAKSAGEWSPLFRLPDDEVKAAEIVDLFVSLGADAGFRRKDGLTAADIARRRGLDEAARKLEAAAKIAELETLATDLIAAFDTGDTAAMERINKHYGQSLTPDDLRAQVWRRVYSARHAGGGPGSLSLEEARLMVARTAGFANWNKFLDAAVHGAPPAGAPYAIDAKEQRFGPRRLMSAAEWDDAIAVIRERRIAKIDAHGFMTDAALERISRLDHVTHLALNGSRELSDDGLAYLAQMPQLQHLELSEYPGGKLTDRGLEVLRHLPELRSFSSAWQKGFTDAGIANLRFCDKLEKVQLMGTPTGDGAVAALRDKPLLRVFESGRLVTDAGLAMLRDFPLFRSWQGKEPLKEEDATRLMIDGPFTNAGLANLEALDGVYALDLFWHTTEITSEGFGVLTRMANLRSLGADGTLSDNRAMQYYAVIPRLIGLRSQGAAADDDGFIALSKSKTLEKFWGREAPRLTGRGFVALSKMPNLRAMGVSLAHVDDNSLATLPHFPALRDLTPIDVRDEGFRHIGKCMGLQRLACMYCRDTTDIATEHIRNLAIKSYYAGKTKITDRSLEILGTMITLERIEFWECAGITDAGLPFLAGLPSLREVEFGASPKITLEGTTIFPARVHVHYWT